MSPSLALLAIAVIAAAAMWLALHVVPRSELNALPIRFRRRITWWHLHVRWVYTCCAVVAAGASLTHLSG
ncbi:MAG TPA: hypothetical protein VGL39_11335 [Jatrophihabitantaceae bacterium]|jgi:hypothetical protein